MKTVCHKCHELKSFYDGYDSNRLICKDCQKEYSNIYNENHREYTRNRNRIMQNKNYSKEQKISSIIRLKIKHGIKFVNRGICAEN